MNKLGLPADEAVYTKLGSVVVFNQLAVKIEMDSVSNGEYFEWLDRMTEELPEILPGGQIVEKKHARVSPPLNTAVYYDTPDYRILPTGALLRTSCNKVTHAFCAFKMAQDDQSVRRDHRYVFSGAEKRTIQEDPASESSVGIVHALMARTDIEHPGTFLRENLGVDPTLLRPAIYLDDLRYTFFVWLDEQDALRCSIDRATVMDLRLPEEERERRAVSEVELAIYPRVRPHIAHDARVVDLIRQLSRSLESKFDTRITTDIKYQRAAHALGIDGR
jgi:hypothetical protein